MRKDDLDQRFPGLTDFIIAAGARGAAGAGAPYRYLGATGPRGARG
jgi:hypothetical protein